MNPTGLWGRLVFERAGTYCLIVSEPVAMEGVEVVDTPPISRDPNDDKFLATARVANADYLVIEDNDLFVLGEYQGVRIVDSRTFLRQLANDNSGR